MDKRLVALIIVAVILIALYFGPKIISGVNKNDGEEDGDVAPPSTFGGATVTTTEPENTTTTPVPFPYSSIIITSVNQNLSVQQKIALQGTINISLVINKLDPITVDGNIGPQTKAALKLLCERTAIAMGRKKEDANLIIWSEYFSKFQRGIFRRGQFIVCHGRPGGKYIELQYKVPI